MSTISRSQFAEIRAQQLGRPVCADPDCDARPLRTSDMCGRHKGRNKHHAESTEAHGKVYLSKLEADRGAQLRWLQTCGEIRDLAEQVVVELAGAVSYRADFQYVETKGERLVHEDAKGVQGERWRVIRQLWPLWGPTPLLVSMRQQGRIAVVETILPQPQRRLAWMEAEATRLTSNAKCVSLPEAAHA